MTMAMPMPRVLTSATNGTYAVQSHLITKYASLSDPLQKFLFLSVKYSRRRAGDESWYEKATNRIASFGSLSRGWNGYEADPPSEMAISKAKRFIEMLHQEYLEPGRVSPSAVGGIGITFERSDFQAYFEIYNNGDSYLLLSKGEDGDAFPQAVDSDAIERIRGHLGQ
jgi:hypothetical protein